MTKPETFFYDLIPINYELDEIKKTEILTNYPPPTLPDGDDFLDIQKMERGESVKLDLLLNDFTNHLTRTQKQFLRVSFSNNHGVIPAILWDNQGEVAKYQPLLEEHSLFTVEGKIGSFNGRKSITIYKLTVIEEVPNPFDYLPFTQMNLEELTVELFSYIEELNDPFKQVVYGAMDRFWKQFSIRPAAKSFHHNYLGGLLKHTVGLMRFARYILKSEENHYQAIMKLIHIVEKAFKNELWEQFQQDVQYPNYIWKDTLDHLYTMLQGAMAYKTEEPSYDIVMTSILYHDLGKILEYDHAGKTFEDFAFLYPSADLTSLDSRKQAGITMDPLGVMVGHIPYGFLLLTRIIEADDVPVALEDIHRLSHCILAHHGLPEWGSCMRKPQSVEGYIVHIVDFLDSRYENTEEIK